MSNPFTIPLVAETESNAREEGATFVAKIAAAERRTRSDMARILLGDAVAAWRKRTMNSATRKGGSAR